MANDVLPDELMGLRLHGEDMDAASLAAWHADEADGYARISGEPGYAADEPSHANRYHAFRFLPEDRIGTCLALGAASGREYSALRGRVDRFVAIEPGRSFWREEIAGAPADYRLPGPDGRIDLPDGICDLAGSFGVLHHVPNVSATIAEVSRVLAPGGHFLIREPISSLGDFRKARPGLTRNERGIPPAMMNRMLAEAGLVVLARRFCNFPGTRELPWRLGIASAWDNAAIVRIDALICGLTAWNARYWRPRLIDKLAPRAAYWIAQKPR